MARREIPKALGDLFEGFFRYMEVALRRRRGAQRYFAFVAQLGTAILICDEMG
ncbi:MAG: hypothetical protein AAF667_18835 [Pseudomonadota bacterium]